MCGIAGIVYKNSAGQVGDALLKMLHGCQHRGPDSTGLAMYGPPPVAEDANAGNTDPLILRLFLDSDLSLAPACWPGRFDQLRTRLAQLGYQIQSTWQQRMYAKVTGTFDGDIQKLSYAIEELPGIEIFSAGHSLEIVKDQGTSDDLESRFNISSFTGHHGIGHVRLATESDVNPSTAHPFWAYGFKDISIVHNGQITNYFKLRRRLEQLGYRFRTENDSEVIAVYLADKMQQGTSMDEALAQSLDELDGTFSFLVSTPDGIGYAKDTIGAKPMVVYETDDIVAVASEEVSLQQLLGHDKIQTHEPFPGTSHSWSRSTPASLQHAI